MSTNDQVPDKQLQEILDYHARPPAGKIFTGLAKPVATQQDLSIAYSPGVAEPCRIIAKEKDESFRYTGRGNLVGVISNGTAVLGLGNIGPEASKPVMEGKAMLFKRYADIDVFDIELNAPDPDAFIEAVAAMEPTFGGINLEDIAAPTCFYIEEQLRERMAIPVMHDDQHGTAIIASAALLNALEIADKKLGDVRVVFSGSGAAAIACAQLMIHLGVKAEKLFMCDSHGVIHKGRTDLDPYKARFVRDTPFRTLEDALDGADVFVGVSVANVLSAAALKKMGKNPVVFALANPDPEIHPELARQTRPDAIIATGRSDFPNQVNNVLGFPFIFRGALDVRAREINEEMKLAAVKAIAALAKEDVPDVVLSAYKEEGVHQFGRDYLIPKPVDPRVLFHVAPAVAKAAMDSGVARIKIDIDDYKRQIERMLGPTQRLMRRLQREISAAYRSTEQHPRIVVPYAFDSRALRAAAQVADESDIAITLLGSPERIRAEAQALGLKDFGEKVSVIDPITDKRLAKFSSELFELRQRKGVSKAGSVQLLQNHNYFASMLIRMGEADGLIAGLVEPYASAARPIIEVIGRKTDEIMAGIYMVMNGPKQYFFADCTINGTPDAETLAQIAVTTAKAAARYTTEPLRIAMLSFASFGSARYEETKRVAEAVQILNEKYPDLEVDGEMQADVALNSELREREFPFCKLSGDANVLIFPNLAAGNIAYKLLTNMSSATPTGPILTGINAPCNVLQRSATTQEVIDLIYLTAHQTLKG